MSKKPFACRTLHCIHCVVQIHSICERITHYVFGYHFPWSSIKFCRLLLLCHCQGVISNVHIHFYRRCCVHTCSCVYFFSAVENLAKKHEKHILAHAHICKFKIAAAFNRILYTKLLFFTRNFVQFEAGH